MSRQPRSAAAPPRPIHTLAPGALATGSRVCLLQGARGASVAWLTLWAVGGQSRAACCKQVVCKVMQTMIGVAPGGEVEPARPVTGSCRPAAGPGPAALRCTHVAPARRGHHTRTTPAPQPPPCHRLRHCAVTGPGRPPAHPASRAGTRRWRLCPAHMGAAGMHARPLPRQGSRHHTPRARVGWRSAGQAGAHPSALSVQLLERRRARGREDTLPAPVAVPASGLHCVPAPISRPDPPGVLRTVWGEVRLGSDAAWARSGPAALPWASGDQRAAVWGRTPARTCPVGSVPSTGRVPPQISRQRTRDVHCISAIRALCQAVQASNFPPGSSGAMQLSAHAHMRVRRWALVP